MFEQEQLINRQLIDTLTGLPNRLKLLQGLEKKQHHALTIFNLDAFSCFGHDLVAYVGTDFFISNMIITRGRLCFDAFFNDIIKCFWIK